MKDKGLNLIYKKIIIFICFSIFFLRWYNDSYILNYFGFFSMIFLVIYIIFMKKKNLIKKYKKEITPLALLIVYIIINTLMFNEYQFYFANLYLYLIVPISYLMLLRMIFEESEFVDKFIINKGWKYVNAFQIINGIFLILQIIFKGFMVRDIYNNAYYADNITGLLGNSGTHRLAFSFLIAIYINYIIYKKSEGKKKNNALIFMILITLFSIIISFFNDNKFYFILLILFYIPIFIDIMKKSKNKKRFFNITILLLLIMAICIAVLLLVKKDMFSDTLTYGDERINLFKFAIEYSNFFVGKGIGSIEFLYAGYMPKHFGMCELTSRIYTGGIIYLALIIHLYVNTFIRYINNKKVLLKLYFDICFIALCYYTMVFSHVDISILITFLFFLVGYIFKDSRKENT